MAADGGPYDSDTGEAEVWKKWNPASSFRIRERKKKKRLSWSPKQIWAAKDHSLAYRSIMTISFLLCIKVQTLHETSRFFLYLDKHGFTITTYYLPPDKRSPLSFQASRLWWAYRKSGSTAFSHSPRWSLPGWFGEFVWAFEAYRKQVGWILETNVRVFRLHLFKSWEFASIGPLRPSSHLSFGPNLDMHVQIGVPSAIRWTPNISSFVTRKWVVVTVADEMQRKKKKAVRLGMLIGISQRCEELVLVTGNIEIASRLVLEIQASRRGRLTARQFCVLLILR